MRYVVTFFRSYEDIYNEITVIYYNAVNLTYSVFLLGHSLSVSPRAMSLSTSDTRAICLTHQYNGRPSGTSGCVVLAQTETITLLML